jgi:hypothetical protein
MRDAGNQGPGTAHSRCTQGDRAEPHAGRALARPRSVPHTSGMGAVNVRDASASRLRLVVIVAGSALLLGSLIVLAVALASNANSSSSGSCPSWMSCLWRPDGGPALPDKVSDASDIADGIDAVLSNPSAVIDSRSQTALAQLEAAAEVLGTRQTASSGPDPLTIVLAIVGAITGAVAAAAGVFSAVAAFRDKTSEPSGSTPSPSAPPSAGSID